LALASCGSSAKPLKEVTILSQNSNHKAVVRAEVAADDASRMQGLMFRKDLGKEEGMLFLFPADGRMPFWMHNTYLPLDIIFIGADHRIVDIAERAKPLSDELIQSKGLYRYVLEVNAGYAEQHRLKAGDRVEF